MQVQENHDNKNVHDARQEQARAWSIRLFQRSLLKQDKLAEIQRLLPRDLNEKRCLDLGGDNGVISMLLREKGGQWQSVDMSPKAVASMKLLLQEDSVHQVDGYRFPFPDDHFDVLVIIDMMEHVENDLAFVKECHRVMKPGGDIIVNVPHVKKVSFIRMLHKILGMTDADHGHVRPGYTHQGLYHVLRDGFDIVESHTYSRFFVQLVDTAIRLVGGSIASDSEGDAKGHMIDAQDLKKYEKAFRLYGMIYPVLWFASRLDKLLFFTEGHMLIAQAKWRKWVPRREVKIQDGRSIAEASINTKIGTAAPF